MAIMSKVAILPARMAFRADPLLTPLLTLQPIARKGAPSAR